MNKKAKLSLVILSAVLFSACTAKTPAVTPDQTGENQPTAAPAEQSQATSLRELLANGQNQKCTFSMSETDENDNKTTTDGTLYISGKKMAEEVQITNSGNGGMNTNMMMISDSDKIYTWDPSKKTPGMMFKMTAPTGTEDNKTQNQNVDLDKKIDMKCSPWAADESKFTVPTDVKFTDLSELMKNIPTVPAIPTGE